MKLKRMKFGRTDYRVSELCLSTSNLSRYASHDESFAILDAFRTAGGNFIQTSGISPGMNFGDGFLGMPEELLGRWLKLRRIARRDIVIATRMALMRPVIGGQGAYTELIRQCAADSIRRMGCDYLDFLVIEWTDGIAPVAESMAAFEAVIASGEVRHVVPANFAIGRVLEGLATMRREPRAIAGVQGDYSLATRMAFEGGIAKLSADHGLGVIARSPLAGGYLASRRLSSGLGALRSRGIRDRHAAIAAEGIWPALSSIARKRRRSPAQIALSWVLAHPQVTSVLISVASVDQFRELLSATRLKLSDDDMARLGRAPIREPRSALALRKQPVRTL
jgi:aryl-alcohol dehydrogenase-like predicted oxidoreductase